MSINSSSSISQTRPGSNALLRSIRALGKVKKAQPKLVSETTDVPCGQKGASIQKTVKILNSVQTTTSNQFKDHSKFKAESKNEQKTEQKKVKKHKVKITQQRTFEPSNLKVQKGDTVEWSLMESETSNVERNQSSLYHLNKRSHVVSFRTINEESDPIRTPTDTYRLRFFNVGVFQYQCSIYTRMTGTIEVVDNSPKQVVAPKILKPDPHMKLVAQLDASKRRAGTSQQRNSRDRSRSVSMLRSDKSASELSQRLIEVLHEEDDLRKQVAGHADAPVIKQNYFHELFESQRGDQMLKIHKVELSDGGDSGKVGGETSEYSEADEEAFLRKQRLFSKIKKGHKQLDNLNRIKEAREAASRQGSNTSSSYKTKSIQELKARGYFELPQRQARPIWEEPLGSGEDEDNSSGDESFWRKPKNDVEPKSPVVYDKQTYIKFDSFSRMFHKNHSASKDISDTEFVQDNFGCVVAQQKTTRTFHTDIMTEQNTLQESETVTETEEYNQAEGKAVTDFSNFDQSSQMEPPSGPQRVNICDDISINYVESSKTSQRASEYDREEKDDEQRELDEIALLNKQRQNQKKKLRKKKAKQVKQETTTKQNENNSFDAKLVAKVLPLPEIRKGEEIEAKTIKDESSEFLITQAQNHLQDLYIQCTSGKKKPEKF